MTNFKRQQHDKLFQETAASRFKRQQHHVSRDSSMTSFKRQHTPDRTHIT
eukprot:CAMPEP_0177647662 /NCGR_PEP_ID=MMETSP0447-20121125/10420_1 /TAXON_ID=0 /ORGANISM="Stygamoeba regulata, Strain BSH-02190019" /LENGTH=49 /DNA_ID=CAMNT_0019150263 /DNA_START=501 /DNA_END=650 /DNA_ORIENTATION=+